MSTKVAEIIKAQKLELLESTNCLNEAVASGNYGLAFDALVKQSHILGISLPLNTIDDIHKNRNNLNWQM